ncbi:hypothetical protein IG631_22478 [Alternaria alternata]|nr:hypothetical protein IG631_22478 [Alternaria alternata]
MLKRHTNYFTLYRLTLPLTVVTNVYQHPIHEERSSCIFQSPVTLLVKVTKMPDLPVERWESYRWKREHRHVHVAISTAVSSSNEQPGRSPELHKTHRACYACENRPEGLNILSDHATEFSSQWRKSCVELHSSEQTRRNQRSYLIRNARKPSEWCSSLFLSTHQVFKLNKHVPTLSSRNLCFTTSSEANILETRLKLRSWSLRTMKVVCTSFRVPKAVKSRRRA